MNINNLNRAKDLLAMKNEALRLIEANTKAITFLKKYTWDCGLYPFSVDGTYQNTTYIGGTSTPNKDSKFYKKIIIRESNHYESEILCTIPLDLLIKAIQDEINRLSDRVEEIDKEVSTL